MASFVPGTRGDLGVRAACVALVGVLAILGAAQGAFAQGRGDEEARALFIAGQVAYEEGRYDAAVDHFKRSYELSARPELLYNLGQAYDRLRRDAEALEAFRAFLGAVPDSPHRRQVEMRIAALDRAVAEREAVPEPEEVARAEVTREPDAASPSRVPVEERRGGRIALWTSIAAVAVAGIVVGVVVATRPDDVTREDPILGSTGILVVARASR